MNDRPDNPGVRVPPPLFFVLAVLLGWLLNRSWPLPVGGTGLRWLVAGALIVASVALTASGIRALWKRNTSMLPFRPAMTMVVAGPYRFTRNPMYVGLALLIVAFGLLLNTWWPMVLLIPALMAVQNFVIVREEHYLRRRFGAEYDEYARRVRRWI